MAKKVTLERKAFDQDPHLAWNTFVQIIAISDYNELSVVQRPSHLIFWYESEVQNGGHLQFFENQGTKHLQETIKALKHIGANEQATALANAGTLYLSVERKNPLTVEEYVSESLKGELSEFDKQFHESRVSLLELLQTYFESHMNDYLEIV